MLEILLLMLAVSVQSAGQAGGASTVATNADAPAAIAVPAPQDKNPAGTVAPPAFLAPTAPAAAVPAPRTEALQAEPQVPSGRFTTAVEVKPILNATKANWISVRDFNGQDLLYVSQLWSWRCGLLDLKIGINGNPPEPWPLPPCHLDQAAPNAILPSDGLPYRSFPPGSIAMIEVRITYDDLSTDGGKFNRQGLPIQ